MSENKQYILNINGTPVEVSYDVYEAYYQGARKQRYFEHDLKEGRTRKDPNTGLTIMIPSREDSYERLAESNKQFVSAKDQVEDLAMQFVMLEKLNEALLLLSKEERELIQEVFFYEKTERQCAELFGLSQKGINKRKIKILEKLRKILEN